MGNDDKIAARNHRFQATVSAEKYRPASSSRRLHAITDEEMIEGLSFASYRRIATMIMVPGAPPQTSSMEMLSIDSDELSDAQRLDASAQA